VDGWDEMLKKKAARGGKLRFLCSLESPATRMIHERDYYYYRDERGDDAFLSLSQTSNTE
jgi:hypothetical protein